MTFLYYLSGFVTSNVPLSVLHKHVPKTVLKRQCRPVHSHSLASTVALAQVSRLCIITVHSHSLASTVALAQFELALLLQLLTDPLLFPLSGMGLALRLPQRVVQTCFCGLSSPHLHLSQFSHGGVQRISPQTVEIRIHRVTLFPNPVRKHVRLNMLAFPIWVISAQPPKPSTTPPSQRRRSGRPWPLCLLHQPQGHQGSLGQWSNTSSSPSPRDLPHSSMHAWTRGTILPYGDRLALLCSRNPTKRTPLHPGLIGLSRWRSASGNC